MTRFVKNLLAYFAPLTLALAPWIIRVRGMLAKKHSLAYVSAVLLFLAAVLSPIGAKVAYAGTVGDALLKVLGLGGEGLAFIVAQVINILIYTPSAWILRAAAFVFESVVPYSLGIKTGAMTLSAFQSTFITDGWGILRDMTNIVFIFAMLYIALATILQLGAGKNTRALLVNIILVAISVNFSLFVARIVIDGGNLLAYEFYNALRGSNPHGLAAIVIQGFSPQSLFNTRSFESWITQYDSSYLTLIVLYLFGGAVQLVAAYAILLAAFLFVGRIIMLWILMILSPLAFTAYVLPKTQHWFWEWWRELLNQAFVAPVFLFFYFLFALFIGTALPPFMKEVSDLAGKDEFLTPILRVTLGFSLTIGFLMIALKMTKKMSGQVAEMATQAVGFTAGAAGAIVGGAIGGAGGAKMGASLAGSAVGRIGGSTAGVSAGEKFGRVAGAPLRVTTGALGVATRRGVREGVGRAAEGIIENVPGGEYFASGLGAIGARAREKTKADVADYEKENANLSAVALRAKAGRMTTTLEEKTAIIKILGEKKKLTPQDEDGLGITNTLEAADRRGYDAKKEIKGKHLLQYATEQKDRITAAETLSVDAMKEIGKRKEKNAVSGEEGPSTFFDDPKVFDAAMKKMNPAHFNTLSDPETRDDFADNFLKNLNDAFERAKKARNEEVKKFNALPPVEKVKREEELKAAGKPSPTAVIKTIDDYFRSIGNSRGEQWVKTEAAHGMLDTKDIKYAEKKKKKGEEGEETDTEEEKEKPPVITPGSAYNAREEIPRSAPQEGSPLKSASDIAREQGAAPPKEGA